MLYISVIGGDGAVKASAEGEKNVVLVYDRAYVEGDRLCMKSDAPCFVMAQPEDSFAPVLGYLKDSFFLTIPFGEKKISYSEKNFSGLCHLLRLRIATEFEVDTYRNLAFNPVDSHENSGLFPHASANVETRGESVFAARNAINGNTCSISHGAWPYESWGINRREDAVFRVDFGREVSVNQAVITLRADFPHDNWWTEATLVFSDGSEEVVSFVKSGEPQSFGFAEKKVSWVEMCRMKKDETDPSPFPALTQLEIWGI